MQCGVLADRQHHWRSRHVITGHDAPLTSDIEGTARPFSHWGARHPVRTWWRLTELQQLLRRAAPGCIASLILPGDVAWNEVRKPLPDGIAKMPMVLPLRVPRTAVERCEIAAFRREDGNHPCGSWNQRKDFRSCWQDC
jgi:hypothetical protein